MLQPRASTQDADALRKAPGLTILAKLMISFVGFILLLGVLLVVVYRELVPDLVRHQIELRAESITKSFGAAALQPLIERNYLGVNRVAEATAGLPDVAYATALNTRGIAVAGIFGELDRFDRHFAELVRQQGFPKDVAQQHRMTGEQAFGSKIFTVGGQEILEYAMRLGESGAEVHVGLFTAGMQEAINATLTPLIILLLVMAVVGGGAFFLVSQSVSVPIRQLSEQADYISKGHLDREIDIKAGGEVWQLAESFKRMQASIKFSVIQLRRQQAKQREEGQS